VRIVTLNLRHGGGARTDAIIAALVRHEADVLVLSEFRANDSGRRVRDRLREAGYPHWADGSPPVRTNSVGIASRVPFADIALPLGESANRHRIVEVAVHGLTLGAVYFPLNAAKVTFWREEFLPLAAARFGQPYVFVGDWNTGRHFVDEEGATFFAAAEFAALSDSGWTDAWRSLHPQERDYSWFSTAGNGFRLDHAFLSPALAPRLSDARLSHAERLARITDHSALIVELVDEPDAPLTDPQ
jgi:exodeoxyribonuclease-3